MSSILQPINNISDRFELGEQIGEGSTGYVVRAQDKENRDLDLALKVLDPRRWGNGFNRDIKDFELAHREVESWASLSGHRRFPRFHGGYYEPDLTHYICLDRIDGVTLRQDLDQRLQHGNKYSPEEIRCILIGISEGIHAVHHLNRVHRDLSSNNVMVDGDLNVKHVDLGFLTAENMLRSLFSTTCGTLGYTSP
ncbi:TPA: protein kinase [Candidatus Woesearchaeota archaeon]|nr:protein kinase [Candidatus Woesearchaeota archaeon]